MKWLKWLALLLACGVVAHHYNIHGKLFDIEDLNSHEVIATFLIGFWLGGLV